MSKTILAVEDDSISRFMIEKMCEALGYLCKSVADGQQCLDEIAQRPHAYSVILMDIHMPKVSGVEATSAIRGFDDDPPKNLPIIAVTADDHWQNPQRCKENGFSDVVSKPVTIDALTSALEKFVRPMGDGEPA